MYDMVVKFNIVNYAYREMQRFSSCLFCADRLHIWHTVRCTLQAGKWRCIVL